MIEKMVVLEDKIDVTLLDGTYISINYICVNSYILLYYLLGQVIK